MICESVRSASWPSPGVTDARSIPNRKHCGQGARTPLWWWFDFNGVFQYHGIAAMTIFFYEYLMMLPDEVRRFSASLCDRRS